MKDDEDLYEFLRKYVKRSGIRRLYSWDTGNKKSRLLLEFVIRGKVLFVLPLWRVKGWMDDV